MTQALATWEGIDFSTYQPGDFLIISEKKVLTTFRGHRSIVCFQEELRSRAKSMGLHLFMFFRETPEFGREYVIAFLDFEPPDFTVDHDAEMGNNRKGTSMKAAVHVHADGTKTETEEIRERDGSYRR